MKFSAAVVSFLIGVAIAAPAPGSNRNRNEGNAIEQIIDAFNDPKGFPAGEGDPRDRNGDGLIDPEEFNSRVKRSPQQNNGNGRNGKKNKKDNNGNGNAVDQILAGFNNPKGFPAGEGDPRDRNGDGLIDPQEFNSKAKRSEE